jgi:Ca-activated chloride channel family protein
MVRKIPPIQKPVRHRSRDKRIRVKCFAAVLFLTVAIPAIALQATAESLADKNREGNRLFAESKYEEAEKAYLDAQAKSPGHPEILYNLGNALIKQRKYSQGIRALRQSSDSGNEQIKTDSLYNTGNALYTTGDYKGSADAFIEALKLNPEDKDAKHNLELALEKLQEQQQQKQSDSSKEQKDSRDQEKNRPKENKGDQAKPKEQNREQAQNPDNRQEPAKMQPNTPTEREGSMTSEQAEKILDAVRNQELEQQRKLMESRSRPKTNKRDW